MGSYFILFLNFNLTEDRKCVNLKLMTTSSVMRDRGTQRHRWRLYPVHRRQTAACSPWPGVSGAPAASQRPGNQQGALRLKQDKSRGCESCSRASTTAAAAPWPHAPFPMAPRLAGRMLGHCSEGCRQSSAGALVLRGSLSQAQRVCFCQTVRTQASKQAQTWGRSPSGTGCWARYHHGPRGCPPGSARAASLASAPTDHSMVITRGQGRLGEVGERKG